MYFLAKENKQWIQYLFVSVKFIFKDKQQEEYSFFSVESKGIKKGYSLCFIQKVMPKNILVQIFITKQCIHFGIAIQETLSMQTRWIWIFLSYIQQYASYTPLNSVNIKYKSIHLLILNLAKNVRRDVQKTLFFILCIGVYLKQVSVIECSRCIIKKKKKLFRWCYHLHLMYKNHCSCRMPFVTEKPHHTRCMIRIVTIKLVI